MVGSMCFLEKGYESGASDEEQRQFGCGRISLERACCQLVHASNVGDNYSHTATHVQSKSLRKTVGKGNRRSITH